MNIVIASGGFDPIHIGHIKYLKAAKKFGYLIVILNNDNWLMKKKGFVFQNENERKIILESLKFVDEVMLSYHDSDPEDMSISQELMMLHYKWDETKWRPDRSSYFKLILANGGDRNSRNIPERKLCKDLGIELKSRVGGGKIQSSSELVKKVRK